MKLYCNNCFSKTEYKFSKPKFCPECGSKTSALANADKSIEIDNLKSIQKIKDLENQLLEFTGRQVERKKTIDSTTHRSRTLDDNELGDDYVETQRHINNFKRNAKRSGVIVEKSPSDCGISFGQLIENSSSSGRKSDTDFQMKDSENFPKKTNQQILEEMKLEASSVSRPIEID